MRTMIENSISFVFSQMEPFTYNINLHFTCESRFVRIWILQQAELSQSYFIQYKHGHSVNGWSNRDFFKDICESQFFNNEYLFFSQLMNSRWLQMVYSKTADELSYWELISAKVYGNFPDT